MDRADGHDRVVASAMSDIPVQGRNLRQKYKSANRGARGLASPRQPVWEHGEDLRRPAARAGISVHVKLQEGRARVVFAAREHLPIWASRCIVPRRSAAYPAARILARFPAVVISWSTCRQSWRASRFPRPIQLSRPTQTPVRDRVFRSAASTPGTVAGVRQ